MPALSGKDSQKGAPRGPCRAYDGPFRRPAHVANRHTLNFAPRQAAASETGDVPEFQHRPSLTGLKPTESLGVRVSGYPERPRQGSSPRKDVAAKEVAPMRFQGYPEVGMSVPDVSAAQFLTK